MSLRATPSNATSNKHIQSTSARSRWVTNVRYKPAQCESLCDDVAPHRLYGMSSAVVHERLVANQITGNLYILISVVQSWISHWTSKPSRGFPRRDFWNCTHYINQNRSVVVNTFSECHYQTIPFLLGFHLFRKRGKGLPVSQCK